MHVQARRRAGIVFRSTATALILVCSAAERGDAAGDAAKGEHAFARQCAICHTVDQGGPNRFGPNLFGILHRKAASAPGFDYSRAFKTTATWEWNADLVAGWISAPGQMVPGTAMGVFQGVAQNDRDDIVAYLATRQ